MMRDNTHSRRVRWLLAALLALSALAVTGVATGANVSDKAPYYDNQSDQVRNETWMDNRTEPTLDNTTHYLTRVGGFVIGQQPAQGGVGPAGVMLLSLVLFGSFVGLSEGRSVGPIGGAVLAVALASGVATVGLAPHWIYAVVIMGLGLVLAAVAIRIFR